LLVGLKLRADDLIPDTLEGGVGRKYNWGRAGRAVECEADIGVRWRCMKLFSSYAHDSVGFWRKGIVSVIARRKTDRVGFFFTLASTRML
jgi:hypothetical protein